MVAKGVSKYIPTEGFFDLSQKPPTLSDKEHKKIQKIQMSLIREAEKFRNPVIKQNNRHNFEQLQKAFAQLQEIIFNYYGCIPD